MMKSDGRARCYGAVSFAFGYDVFLAVLLLLLVVHERTAGSSKEKEKKG